MCNCEFIHKADVPAYLHDSELFHALDDDDASLIPVPKNCMRSDGSYNNNQELYDYLLTMRFWGLPITDGLIEYCLLNDIPNETIDEFKAAFPFLVTLSKIQSTGAVEPLLISIMNKDFDVLKYLHRQGHQLVPHLVIPAARVGFLEGMKYILKCTKAWNCLGRNCSICDLILHTLLMGEKDPGLQEMVAAQPKFHEVFFRSAAHDSALPLFRHPEATHVAARFGQLACLKYAHENGCSWNASLLYKDILFNMDDGDNFMACLDYAREQGCYVPFSTDICRKRSDASNPTCSIVCTSALAR